MKRSAISELRRSPQKASEILRRMVPAKHLPDVVNSLVRSVQIAHQVSPQKWGFRLNYDSIMLKVGFVEVLQVYEGCFHLLVNHDLVPSKIGANAQYEFTRRPYKNARNCDACDVDISLTAGAYRALLSAHESAIRIAASRPRRPDITKDHSPGLIKYLSQQAGTPVPQPGHLDLYAPIPEEILEGDKFFEGARIAVRVNRYERDPRAREICLRKRGLNCSACGLSLADVYGPQVIGLIHVHHIQPLASRGKQMRVDPKKDLCPVCPNCHAVIHSISPPRTIEEVKKMLRQQKYFQRS